MKLMIGIVLLSATGAGSAQSPTFTRKDVATAFLCGKINGGINMGLKESIATQAKMAYVLNGCQEFQHISEEWGGK